ncbi:MAG: hypothetical protein CVT71_00645 [Alphaproteobacteria bacterium HGW-Alphaproteobacteria-10]|nr:MAG: hypothetical protein CVT71_00645 [Alphaproteobacteria bacterium HGW-Alphaproteobacteria-10]
MEVVTTAAPTAAPPEAATLPAKATILALASTVWPSSEPMILVVTALAPVVTVVGALSDAVRLTLPVAVTVEFVKSASTVLAMVLVVTDAWQGSGVGRRLMKALIRHARSRGLKTMYGQILATNTRMLEFAQGLGFGVEASAHGPAVRLVRTALSSATLEA